MNIVQLNTVNLGGDIVVKKSGGDSGGSGEGGGSNWRYFDVRNLEENTKNTVYGLSQFCRYFKYVDMVSPVQMAKDIGVTTTEVQYVCIDFTFELLEASDIITVEQMLGNYGVLEALLTTEITKEEFYALTTE